MAVCALFVSVHIVVQSCHFYRSSFFFIINSKKQIKNEKKTFTFLLSAVAKHGSACWEHRPAHLDEGQQNPDFPQFRKTLCPRRGFQWADGDRSVEWRACDKLWWLSCVDELCQFILDNRCFRRVIQGGQTSKHRSLVPRLLKITNHRGNRES